MVFGTFFFLCGGVFCYFLVLPLGLNFLLVYGTNWWKMQVTIGFYFTFVVKLMLAFGFAFQTPLLMVLMTKFGVVNTVKMKLYRKWAFMGCFAFAALVTPPDIITQLLLGFPLYALYEFGVVVSAFFEDPKNREAALRDIERAKAAKKSRAESAAKNPVVKKVVRKAKKTS